MHTCHNCPPHTFRIPSAAASICEKAVEPSSPVSPPSPSLSSTVPSPPSPPSCHHQATSVHTISNHIIVSTSCPTIYYKSKNDTIAILKNSNIYIMTNRNYVVQTFYAQYTVLIYHHDMSFDQQHMQLIPQTIQAVITKHTVILAASPLTGASSMASSASPSGVCALPQGTHTQACNKKESVLGKYSSHP